MQSSAASDEFLQQFLNIVDGVKHSKTKIENKCLDEKHKHGQLLKSLQGLIDIRRRYVAAVKELSVECKKYESLLALTNK